MTTPDLYGGITVPLLSSAQDPLLDYLRSYMQIVANAYAVTAWSAILPNATQVVATTWNHDPSKYVFSTSHLPALYLYRETVTARVDIAQAMRVERGTIRLLWVPPEVQPETRRLRESFATKFFKALDVYVDRGRDPSWFVAGDTYAGATPRIGSVVATGTSPPTVTLSGTPAAAPYTLTIDIVAGGARGDATFRWSTNGGTTWATTVATAATVVLGSTGITAAFASGTYSANNLYTSAITTRGSVLAQWAGYRRFQMGTLRAAMLDIGGKEPGGAMQSFPAYGVECRYEELLTHGDRFPTFEGIDMIIERPDEDDPDNPLVLNTTTLT